MSRRPAPLAPLGLAAVAVLLSSLVGTASPAVAADPTCQGRPATIASDQTTVTGTEGPDVISVGLGTSRVVALGGDDVICGIGGVSIDAGSGNDSVVVTTRTDTSTTSTRTDLGPGDDTYVGTAGVDVVTTGGGTDRADLGAGDDVVTAALLPGARTDLTGGEGRDAVRFEDGADGGSWRVDLASTDLSRDGVSQGAVRSLEDVTWGVAGIDALTVNGTAASQSLTLAVPAPRLDVHLAGGPDSLNLATGSQPATGGRIDLGDEDNDLLQVTDARRARVDLSDGRLLVGVPSPVEYDVTGVRDVRATAAIAKVDGDARANDITAIGCRVVARGHRGNDLIKTTTGLARAPFTCAGRPDREGRETSDVRRTGVRFHGQGGDDRLFGTDRLGDVLIGGAGRDHVDGRGGPDRCEAERRTDCGR